MEEGTLAYYKSSTDKVNNSDVIKTRKLRSCSTKHLQEGGTSAIRHKPSFSDMVKAFKES